MPDTVTPGSLNHGREGRDPFEEWWAAQKLPGGYTPLQIGFAYDKAKAAWKDGWEKGFWRGREITKVQYEGPDEDEEDL